MKRILPILLLVVAFSAKAQPPVFHGDISDQILSAQFFEHPYTVDVNKENAVRATINRSDTIDVLHYGINLNVTSFIDSTISGNCEVQFKSKMNGINKILLDLQSLVV